MSIANIINDQIKCLDPMAFWAWGTKNKVALREGLKFKTSGMVGWKGEVRITLNGSDLYDIAFVRVRKEKGGEIEITDNKVTDIFVEDLVNQIDIQVR
jgi:hypothetical protein